MKMAAEQRIYKVTGNNNVYLVQATSQAQALRHIAGKQYSIEVARAVDVAMMMGKHGAVVEIASTIAEQADLIEGAT
jgi:hypothetical protein